MQYSRISPQIDATNGSQEDYHFMAQILPESTFKNTSAIFSFPQDSIGIEQGKSYEDIVKAVRKKFFAKFGTNSDIRWPYKTACPVSRDLQYTHFALRCSKCSNVLFYRKNMNFQIIFRLIKMDRYHLHKGDDKSERQLNFMIRSQKLLTIDKYEKTSDKLNRIRNERRDINNVEEFMKKLPHGLLNGTKAQLVLEHFGISYAQYKSRLRTFEEEYSKTVVQLFQHFDSKGYRYTYLPTDLVKNNQILLQEAKQRADKLAREMNEGKVRPQDRLNPLHWNLPNVIIIVTPQMKQLYLRYGQYVGFDLTYSLIKETPESTKEYLVGVFGGTSQSQRIAVYALVVTNSQTVEMYKYLFQEFISIMGKQPQTFITDQEKSIFYAIKQLKEENLFHGYHLFDTFHILKKFRKASGYEGDSFQLFRKLIHAKNRSQYKELFAKMLDEVHNDEQLNILRSFDYNNSMYCISQIDKTFVGTGISDSPCEKIHDIIKQEIPYQINYVKGVLIILEVLHTRNSMNKFGFIEHFAVEERLKMPFLKPYRYMLSRNIFRLFVKEISKSASHHILDNTKEHCSTIKREHIDKEYQKKDVYFIQTKNGSFTVYKQYQKYNSEYKWHCLCQFQEKTGILCSHIAKVLFYQEESFIKHIHPRWILREEDLQEKSKRYGSKIKYLGKIHKHKPKKRVDSDEEEIEEMSQEIEEVNFEENNDDDDNLTNTSFFSSKADRSEEIEPEIDPEVDQISSEPKSKVLAQAQESSNFIIDQEVKPIQRQPQQQLKKSDLFLKNNSQAKDQEEKMAVWKRWSLNERELYLKFLINNFELMKSDKRRDKTDRYLKMSRFIETRTKIQCQNYHAGKMEEYGTLQNLIFEFKAKHDQNEL